MVLAASILLALSACTDDAVDNEVAVEPAVDTAPSPQTTVEPATPQAEPTPTSVVAPTPQPPLAAPAPTPDPVIFNNDFGTSIAPIFVDNCASCHNADGPGAPHWRLDTAADLVATHEWIAGAVETEYMPPWPANDEGLVFRNDRSLTDDEIAAVVAWSAAGAPLDVDESLAIAAPDSVASFKDYVEVGPHESFQGSSAVTGIWLSKRNAIPPPPVLTAVRPDQMIRSLPFAIVQRDGRGRRPTPNPMMDRSR